MGCTPPITGSPAANTSAALGKAKTFMACSAGEAGANRRSPSFLIDSPRRETGGVFFGDSGTTVVETAIESRGDHRAGQLHECDGREIFHVVNGSLPKPLRCVDSIFLFGNRIRRNLYHRQ